MSQRNSLVKHLTAVSILALCSTVFAQPITYVDAVVDGMTGTVNTTGPTGTTPSDTAFQVRGTNGGSDNSSFANEGSALQYSTNPIDASDPELRTTVGGLDSSKSYNVYVFGWGSNGTDPIDQWDMSAALAGDAFQDYTGSVNGGFVVDSTYQGGPNMVTGLNVLGQGADTYDDFVDGNRLLWGAKVGTVSGQTSADVLIKGSNLDANRTWYDGVGIQEVVPEPSTLNLLGMALTLGMLVRRRRK